METIFLTIHDLTLDARIKYCSDSVEEILGYKPNEVKGKSCWDYFHPDEIPFAKAIHGRGLDLDKAATLNYCRIKNKDGEWIGCECTFTVVYDVLVASTAIYKSGEKSQKRAIDLASIRRVFASSPRDPRYHMLSFIASKFRTKIDPGLREPRAAIVLNRFTRTSTIMFATNGVEQILGFSPAQLTGRSFYYCIAENCLAEAISTVESAKHNDSIAYLRFWFRDPTLPENALAIDDDSESDDEGGIALDRVSRESSISDISSQSTDRAERVHPPVNVPVLPTAYSEARSAFSSDEVAVESGSSRSPSGDDTDSGDNGRDQIFDQPHLRAHSSTSSLMPVHSPAMAARGTIEVEAVVSCTSDGMVLVLRRATPILAEDAATGSAQPKFPNGLFASPWAVRPVLPDGMSQVTSAPDIQPSSNPIEAGLMSAIRDVAVFAWSLTGINGAVIEYAKGAPIGDAIPPGGLPIWDPNAPVGQNENHNGFSGGNRRPIRAKADDPEEALQNDGERSSTTPEDCDEVVWKRVPEMPAYKKPKRRAHRDAFGSDEDELSSGGGVDLQIKKGRKLANGVRHDSSRSS